MNQLDHMLKLIDFFDYMAIISHRINNEYIPQLIDLKTNKQSKINQSKLIKEMKSLIELYSTI